MQSSLALNLTDAPRIEKLKLFMRMQNPPLTFVSLAEPLDITSAVLGKSCSQETMPVYQHKHLVENGIPPELLPIPQDRKSGPKPKTPEQLSA
ncbi:MAG: hypothetical protein DELT_00523 [Desulfovibrio sp.]